MASFQSAARSYATHGLATIPVIHLLYSIFGFQRNRRQMWAFGDARYAGS